MARDKTDKTDKTPSPTRKTKQYNRGADGTHPLDHSFKADGRVETLGGDELTTLTIIHNPPTREHLGGALRRAGPDGFWTMLEEILEQCDEIMTRHGWDRKAGNGRNFPSDRTSNPFSELWYAGKIGQECWNFLQNHRPNNPNTVMLAQAMGLGELLKDLEWRAQYKPSILTGKKQRKTLKELRDTKNRAARDGVAIRRAFIAEMMEEQTRTGGALDNWLQKQLFSRHGITVAPRTIREDRKALRK